SLDPGLRVVFREVVESLDGSGILEASQSGSIVVVDEGDEVVVALLVVFEASVVGGPVLGDLVEMLADAPVEALDHAVGLGSEGSGEAVVDTGLGAGQVEGVL